MEDKGEKLLPQAHAELAKQNNQQHVSQKLSSYSQPENANSFCLEKLQISWFWDTFEWTD